MSNILFHPELFERRAEAMEALEGADIEWMTDYNSVDVAHDIYGIEVIGIKREETARKICAVLKNIFPQWPNIHCFLYDDSLLDPGYWVFISREVAQ